MWYTTYHKRCIASIFYSFVDHVYVLDKAYVWFVSCDFHVDLDQQHKENCICHNEMIDQALKYYRVGLVADAMAILIHHHNYYLQHDHHDHRRHHHHHCHHHHHHHHDFPHYVDQLHLHLHLHHRCHRYHHRHHNC